MIAILMRHCTVVILWLFTLIAINVMTPSAQAPGPGGPPSHLSPRLLETPVVLSGNEIGFRLERLRDGVPVGSIVVYVDGKWVTPTAQ
jgi:hypothetical protein